MVDYCLLHLTKTSFLLSLSIYPLNNNQFIYLKLEEYKN